MNSSVNEIDNVLTNKTKESFLALSTVSFPLAIGLYFLIGCFLSLSRSTKSLIMHPALLIKNAPMKKKQYHLIKLPEFNGTKVKANQQGHISSVKPIGLKKRIRSK